MNLEEYFLPPRTVALQLSREYIPNGFTSFSEAVLGIMPGSFANLISLLVPTHLSDILKSFSDDRIAKSGVFVCGMVPGSVANSCGKIFIGDFVSGINGSGTSIDSFEECIRFSELSDNDTIEITTRSLRIDKLAVAFGKSAVSDFVIHFGDNVHWNGLCNSLSLFPFAVFCCGSEQTNSTSKAVYSHPLSDQRLQQALEGVVPCLLLLSDDYCVKSTIHEMHVKLERELISVAVCNTDPYGAVILALPSRVVDTNSCFKALQIMVRVLSYYFGSVEKAFMPTGNGTTDETDRIISVILFEILCPDLLFEELQMSSEMSWSLFQTRFLEMPYLPLPETVKVSVDSLLSDFEASDFADPFLIPPRRRYVIMGSCIFYKGFLVASHLNTTDLIDIGLFLRHRFILSALSFSPQMASTLCGSLLGSPLSSEFGSSPRGEQSVIWCEVFPSHRNKNIDDNDEPCWPTFGYSEPAGARYVLLVVPKKQTFVAVLLEASGLSAIGSGPDNQLFPDSVIVREASKLLTRLDNVGLLSFCEQGLSSSLGVRLISADVAFPSASLFLQTGSRRSRSGGIVLQTLAVANAKKFSSAIRGFLKSQRSVKSLSSDRPRFADTSDSEDSDYQREITTKKSGITSGISKLTAWFTRQKFRSRKGSGLTHSSSYSDFTRPGQFGLDVIDAVQYVESRAAAANKNRGVGGGAGARERAGVPGSYAGSGGTMSTSEGPGRDEGIPLPLANALPTLFDMSEAHLHSGSGDASASGARGGIASANVGALQDVLFTCPGHVFSFMFIDRNQGMYVCPSDTYSPPGAGMFHRRVTDTFLKSAVSFMNMFEGEDDLEEATFLFPTDPTTWFEGDDSVLEEALIHNKTKSKAIFTGSPCTANDRGNIGFEEADSAPAFTLNPLAVENQSFWCTLRKFPKSWIQEKEDGANLYSSTRMFAVCGDGLASNGALDLGLQFAFDLTL